jgi:hypothetical protein
MGLLPESWSPDSDDICSACVRKFQKWDSARAASCKIWEKGVDLTPRDRLRIQGEGIGHACGRFGVAFGFAGPYLSPIDFRPDDLDLLWKRSR